MEALMWISHSERPLEALELCQALGVERGEADQNARNVPAIETVLRCSMGLITIEASSSTVRLVHFTLQEHLSHASSLFHSPHSMMAEICLTFLNFQCVRELSTDLDSPPVSFPFVGYASCHWGTHARKELSQSAKSLALRLLDDYDKHISSKTFLIHKGLRWHRSKQNGSNSGGAFSGLHGAAYLGIVEIMGSLLKKTQKREWDVNSTDVDGNTPFAWAARMGHEETVRMLLARPEVDPDIANADGRTPLLWAAQDGDVRIMKMLLERADVNPNTTGENGETPLFKAAFEGHERVVKMLLERSNINPNTANKHGRTPLFGAACNGHEGVVKVLLEREDVDPNTPDEGGETPLFTATCDGYEGVVKVLLERVDINPDATDLVGDTSLSQALMRGHDAIAELLCQHKKLTLPSGTALFSPQQPDPHQRPFKRIRRF